MENIPGLYVDNKKCYNCGKVFRTPADLQRHKNRKTPCLIHNITPNQMADPNRCIYCNKILSKKEHLDRHLKTCKIKNGRMDVLVDKVRYEQEIRLLREQMEQQRDEIEQLKKQIIPGHNQVINNNITNNIQNNITINYYTHPDTTTLMITAEDIEGTDKISKWLLKNIYFNPTLPQNHSIYLNNKKTRELLVYEAEKKNWHHVVGGNVDDILTKISNTIRAQGEEIVNRKGAPGDDNIILTLAQPIQEKIISFNSGRGNLSKDDAFEVFADRRHIVKTNVRAAGCPIVK